MEQLDFFNPPSSASSASPILGLTVQLPKPCSVCSGNFGTIGSSAGQHANRVVCTSCGTFFRWLSHREADFITGVAEKFGAPTPIILRGGV
jgi:hypothetical protein